MKIGTQIAAVTTGILLLAILAGHATAGSQIQVVTQPTPAQGVAPTSSGAPVTGQIAGGTLLLVETPDGHIGECTAGLPWKMPDGTQGIVTAAHCLQGSPSAKIYALHNNLILPVGTVKLDAGSTHGDTAFIELQGPTAQGAIRAGRSTLGASADTDTMITKTQKVENNLQIYTLGITTGLLCDWRVNAVGSILVGRKNMAMAVGTAETCVSPGDSGGPVFTRNQQGQAQAVGIITEAGGVPKPGGGKYCILYFALVEAIQETLGGEPLLSGSW